MGGSKKLSLPWRIPRKENESNKAQKWGVFKTKFNPTLRGFVFKLGYLFFIFVCLLLNLITSLTIFWKCNKL